VELITDGGRADWLVPRLQAFGTVGGTAGVGFDAYARVLHPVRAFREDPGSVDEHGDPTVLETGTWRWAAVAQRTGQVVDASTSWSDVSGSRDDDVLFDDGWRIEPPDQGWFDPQLLSALTTHLASATATPLDLVAAVWEGWGDLNGSSTLAIGWQGGVPDAAERAQARTEAERMAAVHRAEMASLRRRLRGPRLRLTERVYLLLSTTLPRLADPTWIDDEQIGSVVSLDHTPQLLWPEDRAWVVATEIDSDSTLVAGSRPLIESVLADERFEAYEVEPASSPV
jgi:hypothetical protein